MGYLVYILAIKHNTVFSVKINFQRFQFLYSAPSIRFDFTDVALSPLHMQVHYSLDRTVNAVRRE